MRPNNGVLCLQVVAIAMCSAVSCATATATFSKLALEPPAQNFDELASIFINV